MSAARKPTREYEYDLMRTVAAAAVVVIHSCALQWRTLDVQTSDWAWITVWDMLSKFSVPLFFMISGRFNLDISRQTNSAQRMCRKVGRLVVAFFFWSSIYTVINLIRTTSLAENWKWIVIEFFSGEYHMWFLFAISGLYLVTPLLVPIANDQRKCQYFLILFFIFQLVLPALAGLPIIGVFITTILEKMEFQCVLGYTGYYILGYYLKKHPLAIRTRGLCYLVGLIGSIFSVVVVIVCSRAAGCADESAAKYLTWNVAGQAVAVYVALQSIGTKRTATGDSRSVIRLLSRYSFGIYLAHPFFLWIFEWLGFVPTIVFPGLGVPLIAATAFLATLLLSYCLRKLPRIGQMIT